MTQRYMFLSELRDKSEIKSIQNAQIVQEKQKSLSQMNVLALMTRIIANNYHHLYKSILSL